MTGTMVGVTPAGGIRQVNRQRAMRAGLQRACADEGAAAYADVANLAWRQREPIRQTQHGVPADVQTRTGTAFVAGADGLRAGAGIDRI